MADRKMATAAVKITRSTKAKGTMLRYFQSGVSWNTARKKRSTTTWMTKSTMATPTVDIASSSRGKATFLMIPALPTTTVVDPIDALLNRFHTRSPQNSQMAKCGWWVREMTLKIT